MIHDAVFSSAPGTYAEFLLRLHFIAEEKLGRRVRQESSEEEDAARELDRALN